MTGKKPEIFLRELLEIDTQNPPGKEDMIVRYIIKRMALNESQYEIFDHGEGRASLVVSIPGESSESVMFLGHIDTVPCGDETAWKYKPVHATEGGDRIYGLGSSDMKSGVAIMLTVLDTVLKMKKTPKKTLRFVFTADEESGCMGAKRVAKCSWMDDVKEILLSEPTDGKVVIAEKGVLWILLKIAGRQAHGAMPEEAKNGNEYLWKAIEWIKNSLPCLEESKLLGKASISTTIFQGGFKSNIIPGSAQAVLDVRTVASSNHNQIKTCLKQIQESFEAQYQVRMTYEIKNEKMVLEEQTDVPLVKKWLSLYDTAEYPKGIPYYTDLAELLRENDGKFVICGPGRMKKMHNVDEYVTRFQLEKVAEKYLEYMNQYC